MPAFAFDDIQPGTITYGDHLVTREEIVDFASRFDPQPFHLDEEAARGTFVGELIASGWHTCCLMMRMLVDGFLADSTSMGAPGVEEVRWLRPVRPGDRLSLRQTVIDTRESRSRPEMGLAHMRIEVLNQHGEPVLQQTTWGLFGRRGTAFDAPAALPGEGPGEEPPAPDDPETEPATSFDTLELGRTTVLGSQRFEAGEVVAFARSFDPQPFHLDEAAALRSHFGALCASGWHTGSAWMRAMVDFRQRAAAAAERRGERAARLGPSPGFKELRWLKPVYAGDTITYTSKPVEKRASGSRQGWGLVFSENGGLNQRGEEVFRFRSAVFWER